MKEPQLTIAIPSNGMLHTQTVSCLLSSLSSLPDKRTVFFPLSSFIPFNRNDSVEYAKKLKSSHLMFIDADVVFPPDGIMQLLKRDKMIIGADYSVRQLPRKSNVKFLDKNHKIINATYKDIPSEPFKCFAVPTGFMLINMDVFKKMKRPYFKSVETLKNFEEYMTEDVYFCKQAGEAGIDVWCDPNIPVGHIGEYIY